jgi:subtilisin family serine protease
VSGAKNLLFRTSSEATPVRGEGVTIAVVDDAVDTRHPEFAGRVASAWDVSDDNASSLPRGWQPHGTKVAGLALAAGIHVSGLAPAARLMGVRVPALTIATGDPTEARAIRWAAEHGADVICCAWAPRNPTADSGRLPEHTRDAIDDALRYGRDGRGCVIVFSAGNDGCDIAYNGYASHPGVIAVGACNTLDKHPSYSGWGASLWCVFPSNDPGDPIGAGASALTTAPVGTFLLGETFYTRFGFTSAACAAVSGIVAQILSAAPHLRSCDAKALLAKACVPIDVEHGEYDARGHSPLYGFGRIDPRNAVALARGNFSTSSI